jgi:hypothetical protein
MKKISLRPSPAMIVACVALFVALGGTTVASVIISSNSQVGRNTISGHKPPSGKHYNIIAGSIGGSDLSPALKSSLKLHCPTGLYRAADLCFDPNPRPDLTMANALKTCALAQMRLPSAGELALVFDHVGAPQIPEWVGTEAASVTTPDQQLHFWGTTLEQDASRVLSFGARGPAQAAPFRCVTSATN